MTLDTLADGDRDPTGDQTGVVSAQRCFECGWAFFTWHVGPEAVDALPDTCVDCETDVETIILTVDRVFERDAVANRLRQLADEIEMTGGQA